MLPGRCQPQIFVTLYIRQRLTEHKANDASSEIHEAPEEVDEQFNDLGGKLECEGRRLLNELAGGGEE
jgi:hypothetical protein